MENIHQNTHNSEADLQKCIEIINTSNNVNDTTTQNKCINDQTNTKVIEINNDTSNSHVNNLSSQKQGKY